MRGTGPEFRALTMRGTGPEFRALTMRPNRERISGRHFNGPRHPHSPSPTKELMMADVSMPAAALAGVVSFLSPCVLPLVPGYLAFISGTSLVEERTTGAPVRRVLVGAVAFVAGFTTVFVLLGASATQIGHFMASRGTLFAKLAGLLVILFGLHTLGVLRIPFLYREKRVHASERPRSFLGAYAIGAAFAFGWTPCIGPILSGVLAMAAMQETVAKGMQLLVVYSLGLGVPFLAAALGRDTSAHSCGGFDDSIGRWRSRAAGYSWRWAC
jgi:cytochrome c-type biogenesis protein